jgi:hypothetical protein
MESAQIQMIIMNKLIYEKNQYYFFHIFFIKK